MYLPIQVCYGLIELKLGKIREYQSVWLVKVETRSGCAKTVLFKKVGHSISANTNF